MRVIFQKILLLLACFAKTPSGFRVIDTYILTDTHLFIKIL